VSALPFRRRVLLTLCALLAVMVVAQVQAQRGFRSAVLARPEDFDSRGFQFCRVPFEGGGRSGSSWSVDYPRADINLSMRLSELTRTPISRTPDGQPHHLLVQLTSEELFNCPFIMMTEVGAATFTPEEAKGLKLYLEKGGFLWADDFWGTNAWEWWEEELRQVLPAEDYPIIDLTPDHPLFQSQFVIKAAPQISSINHWMSSGGDTSERGEDSRDVHTRAILDRQGNVMVLMTHNTDFGDSFEREADDPTYFLQFSVPGYAFGINTLLYAMSH